MNFFLLLDCCPPQKCVSLAHVGPVRFVVSVEESPGESSVVRTAMQGVIPKQARTPRGDRSKALNPFKHCGLPTLSTSEDFNRRRFLVRLAGTYDFYCPTVFLCHCCANYLTQPRE